MTFYFFIFYYYFYMTVLTLSSFSISALNWKIKRLFSFVYLWTAAQGVCILNTITEPVTFCARGWQGTRDQFFHKTHHQMSSLT